MKKTKPLGIYIHIPFCVRKCGYCDFVSGPASDETMTGYIRALCDEVKGYRDKFGCKDTEYLVRTVYIGGGTPSILAPFYVEKVLGLIRDEFEVDEEAEITIEVNPGTVTDEKLRVYKSCGINRLSIGLQSANDDELRKLGRIHDTDDFFRTYKAAAAAGFENINVDIMLAIPGQTKGTLRSTLERVTGLDPAPSHVSAYSLILEEGTPFYDMYAKRGDDEEGGLFSEEEEREMYHDTVRYLAGKGYKRYEISNFAMQGMESRHNSAYWKGVDYIGFGLSASSFVNNTRYRNTEKLDEYMENPCDRELFTENIPIGREDLMSEFMFLGLRMTEGVDETDFERRFGIGIMDVYGSQIDRFIREGLLKKEGMGYMLTDKGVDYGNYVFSGFVN